MKATALDTLLVAKSLLGEAKNLVEFSDRHSCTAGIIVLQDFVELVVLAVLDELDVDSTKSLESKSFDELLGELKKQGVPVAKSGSIKALNKQRVICKHYGQLCESASVVNYFGVAAEFADALLRHVYGKSLKEILATDILSDGVVKNLINDAISSAAAGQYFEALCGLRKAFFKGYEYEYCVYDMRGYEHFPTLGQMLFELRGRKASGWAKSKAWAEQNVKVPMDYVQINYEQVKVDCFEWGCSVVDLENFRRLTPGMVELENEQWHCDYDANYAANELSLENFNYCLDVLLNILLTKQRYDARRKWPRRIKAVETPPIYLGRPVYKMPIQTSEVVASVPADYYYTIERHVSGFNSGEKYFYVHLWPQADSQFNLSFERHFWGYLLAE
ncbi:hypothetical protein LVV83_22155 [Pseudomonas sp. LM20]|uniref:hypothetical protein n=1 Tax=Pseudomonas sp. LM20 TaxID=2899116 RepID=UPI001F3760FC|nr:hypothetical protein [Pseudomonas sp. LM20]MCE5989731.1 hypothetical protein [Pseudomonas sp. LM20]